MLRGTTGALTNAAVAAIARESILEHREWTDLQDRLAELSTNNQHRVADATHAGLVDDNESYKMSVQAIADVIQAVRTEQPVTAK